ncbi:hypothetical protein BDP81DRAFT_425427 [Colletotrichum phormii]|uniref:Uncharacterized protein n=1 Tax=Colletotrichum phormii TaxID=359342 RepID=A0AAI9ZSZ5_9PEZI|nr:uncharacterized protein BDP81DRAFT_425427 [Colletotrichum phormii]KAK1637543.1 hypothetical protein BDP81DRAFT_425427 [Colletotrichum phormii]
MSTKPGMQLFASVGALMFTEAHCEFTTSRAELGPLSSGTHGPCGRPAGSKGGSSGRTHSQSRRWVPAMGPAPTLKRFALRCVAVELSVENYLNSAVDLVATKSGASGSLENWLFPCRVPWLAMLTLDTRPTLKMLK